jgi:hypothetical protein
MKRLVCLVLLSFLSSVPASADDKGTIGWFLDFHKTAAGAKVVDMSLVAINNGFTWANTANKDKGFPKLYCSPPKLVFNGGLLFDMLQKYIEDHSKKTEIMAYSSNMAGFFLLKALEQMFPCK